MTPPKKDGDSLYWVVERQCAEMQVRVALSHRKRGNVVVLATGRALPEAQIDELAHAGVKVVNTR